MKINYALVQVRSFILLALVCIVTMCTVFMVNIVGQRELREQTMFASVESPATCPMDRFPQTSAERVACLEKNMTALYLQSIRQERDIYTLAKDMLNRADDDSEADVPNEEQSIDEKNVCEQ
ncbi:MAG: hypothetical protein NTX72_01085 [Candidatus Uhrbacteria bacterium]|nr:hypothetical protein [Candidatus Uhrbacteria bacterium]